MVGFGHLKGLFQPRTTSPSGCFQCSAIFQPKPVSLWVIRDCGPPHMGQCYFWQPTAARGGRSCHHSAPIFHCWMDAESLHPQKCCFFPFAAGFLNSLGKKAWEHLLHNSDASAKPSEGGDVFYLEAPSWSCIPKQPHPDFSWRIAALRSGFQPAIPSAAHCSAALLHCCLLFFLKTNILRS